MKKVHVRRHAPKHATGDLTEEGKKLALELRKQLKKYDVIIASDKPRAIETAKLLTGLVPKIDNRAGTPRFTFEQEEELHELGEKHKFGIAGVILDTPHYRVMIKEKGESLAELVKETLQKLPENGSALIISHDGVMVAAERVLKNLPIDKAEKTYKPLQGFEVSENLQVIDLE